jgi:type II secretory pathway predicted ATPase ExeA
MFFDFYDLQQEPFSDTAAPGMLFLSGSHKVVIQAIIDGLQAGQECITLLGEPGLGKTFLLHAALAHSDLQHLKAIHIFYSRLSAYDILEMACRELECDGVTQEAEQLTASFYHALLAEHERGRQVVLILDEADTIPSETLEYLLGLAHRRASTGKPLLQIILAGLRAFWQHGNGVLLQSFKKDLATCVTLVPLTYRESLDYIRHRLLQVGTCADSVFTAEAMGEIARYARGNPRILNVLCTNLLITGFLAEQKPIPATTARDVIAAYRGKNASILWRRGVAYAAGVLVVAGLAGAFQYEHRAVPAPGSHNLAQLTRRLQDISSADTAPQPVEIGASPPLTALSTPPSQEEGPFSTAVQYSSAQDEQERDLAPAPLVRAGEDGGEKREGRDTSAPQMAAQDVSPPLETVQSEDSVVWPEHPAALPEPPTPVVPSKTGRMAERPHTRQPRRSTARKAAIPPLPRTPSPTPADKGEGAPAGTGPAEARTSAVTPERSAALQESPPPAVPPYTMRDPDRFNPSAVQKESRAAHLAIIIVTPVRK